MTIIESDTTLAELVIARPGVAPRLEALGLDYCCGGQRSLADAVIEAGLDLEATTSDLEAAAQQTAPASEPEWDGIDGLVDHLESTHHAYLHEALPRLVALAEKVAGVHGTNHPELVDVARLVNELRADLDPHLDKEESVLFPMIRELAAAQSAPSFHCGSLVNPIRAMLSEHDTVGDLLATVRSVTDDFRVPADGCGSYHALYAGLAELEADTHTHVHKENNMLFPAVIEIERALTAAS